MKNRLIVLFVFSVSAFAQTRGEKPKLADIMVVADYVQAEGVWRPDNPNETGCLPGCPGWQATQPKNKLIDQVSQLSCYRHGGKELIGTEGVCLWSDASAPHGMLTVGTSLLKVVAWTESEVVATDSSPECLTTKLIFDLQNKTVISLDMRKPNSKGLFNSCELVPERQTYYLEDTADYYTRKELHLQ
jgi:hypothetical protein